MRVIIEKRSSDLLKGSGVFDWPAWEKEISEFDWYYDSEEHCYILSGDITVYTDIPCQEELSIAPGDYVVFPKGLSCRWKITEAVKKHYCFF